MKALQVVLAVMAVIIVGSQASNKSQAESKPSIDLEDYIAVDTAKADTTNEKKADLSTAGTGYYQPYPYHHGYHHQHHYPAYHHHGYHHHGNHHGYHHHIPHYGHGHGHAHTYLAGDYGHLGSAHVSFGSEINHGYPHHHHYG